MALLGSMRIGSVALAALSCMIAPSNAQEKSAADYFVHQLPGAPATPFIKMHAGYVQRPKALRAQIQHDANLCYNSLVDTSKSHQSTTEICSSGTTRINTSRIGKERLSGSMVVQAVVPRMAVSWRLVPTG